jgi:hypothetical protein
MKQCFSVGVLLIWVAGALQAALSLPEQHEEKLWLALQQTGRQTIADSLPRENRIQSIHEADGEHVIVVELASDQRRLDISVYNLLGKRVLSVYQGKAAAGVREFRIQTSGLPNGIYICVVQGDGFRLAQKLALSR